MDILVLSEPGAGGTNGRGKEDSSDNTGEFPSSIRQTHILSENNFIFISFVMKNLVNSKRFNIFGQFSSLNNSVSFLVFVILWPPLCLIVTVLTLQNFVTVLC